MSHTANLYHTAPQGLQHQALSQGQPAYPLKRALHLVVWLCFVVSSFVLFNPAPVDGIMIGLVLLLPLAGMTRFSRQMYFYLAMMMIISAGAFLGVMFAFTFSKALTHSIITFYLSLFTFVLSGYIAKNPHHSIPLIMNGWTIAALFAVLTGIIGYFDIFGTSEIFTRFQRAKGLFKDPNVFGSYIIPPALYAIYKITHHPLRKSFFPLITLAILAMGILLSFSRGAWINFGLSTILFVYFSYITSRTNVYRLKIIGLTVLSIIVMTGMLMAALQVDKISSLLNQRAHLTQSYDSAEKGGRFYGHAKARKLIPLHPLGIGPNQFGGNYHHEDVHNVYLNLYLDSGWLGGSAYLILILGTLFTGFSHLLKSNKTNAYFLVAYCSFAGNAFEGIIIDSNHWRHFFVLLSMIWGIMAYEKWQKRHPVKV